MRISKEQINDEEYMHSDVEEIIISSNVKRIGVRAFYQCQKLKSVVFECEQIELGYECFAGCKALRSIALPKMDYIPYRCFYGTGLIEVSFQEGLVSIGVEAFMLCNVKKINFPESLKTIGSNAFYGALETETIDFKNVEHLSDRSFCQCKIERLVVGKTIDNIPSWCFNNCYLKEVEILATIPNKDKYGRCRDIIQLDHFSFANNPKMTIKLPKNVNIRSSAFYVNAHPYYFIYLDEPYKDMKLLFPVNEKESRGSKYRVWDNGKEYFIPVEFYEN